MEEHEIPELWLKVMERFGYQRERFRHACSLAYRQSWKGKKLPAWVAEYAELGFSAAEVEAARALPLPEKESEGALLIPGTFHGSLTQILWRPISAEAPLEGANRFWDSPAWWAMLRLRPLASFWERELRSDHYQGLLKLAPRIWIVDETPLPPGAVIAGLEITQWSDLPKAAARPEWEGWNFQRIDSVWKKNPEGPFLWASPPLVQPKEEMLQPVYGWNKGKLEMVSRTGAMPQKAWSGSMRGMIEDMQDASGGFR